MSTQIQWLTPSPLWHELSAAGDLTPYRRPAILRFATDDFMPELQGVLQARPQTLRDYVAQGENWQNPAAGLGSASTGLPLKLYQPTHSRFYLVATSLTCRIPGLPDHTVNRTQGESVAFVVRQLRPNPGFSAADCAVYDPVKCTEYAWIPGETPGWSQVSAADLMPGEERIPLSPTQTGSNGTSRRVLTGLIPASRRQQYVAGRTLKNGSGNGNAGNGTAMDPRADMFNRQVMTPWANLEDWWNTLDAATQGQNIYHDSAIFSSALILLDFTNFLIANIPNVWAAILDNSKLGGLSTAEAALYNTLSAALQQALVTAKQFETQFESAGPGDTTPPSGYPLYSLADPGNAIDPSTLLAPVTAALPPLAAPSLVPPVPQKPSNPAGDFFFIVRCMYLRPQCGRNVGSPPSQPFQMASYFDSDAPARRIQVALPVDTSPEALRKYDKGIAFLISDELSKQMSRVKSLQALSQGDISDPGGGLDVGLICSFSIPIITICALILLLVIVIALNLVFFWIPFFKICLPVPTLKGK
ncbi:MAG: hypothetical protein LAQ69_20880 [Acidobacteriia bacterium]|nr:hypothetical protein [Terriglobia bacterium]